MSTVSANLEDTFDIPAPQHQVLALRTMHQDQGFAKARYFFPIFFALVTTDQGVGRPLRVARAPGRGTSGRYLCASPGSR